MHVLFTVYHYYHYYNHHKWMCIYVLCLTWEEHPADHARQEEEEEGQYFEIAGCNTSSLAV